MKILIAGGNGFIGKHLQRSLKIKHQLAIIDKASTGEESSNNVTYYQNNINSVDEVKKILDLEEPDIIINLISIVNSNRDMSLFKRMFEVNFNVFTLLFEASRGLSSLRLFIQFGSAEEYGNLESPIRENYREEPMSPYALIKQLTTNTAIMFARNYNFPICVIRPSNVFGPGQDTSKFIPYLITQLKDNLEVNITACEQKRDFIHINDLVMVLEKLFYHSDSCRGQIINIASGKGITLKEIVLFCKSTLKSKSVINFGAIPYRENEIMNMVIDITKLEQILGITCEFDFFKRLEEELR